ncbi:MAG: MFS transporter, partial [Spirochaetales bacterium]|nr:MFS transporter [Spirochaetales bacterium]
RAVIYALMFGPFFSMFDSGMVNVGLPVMARDLHASLQDVQWIASIYLLTMSALLPILGSLADRWGRGRMYNLGFFTISLFTLACGFAPNLGFLLLFRVLQAVGGAMVMANGMAIATENSAPRERGRNLGLLASMMAVGSLAGPSIGGFVIGLWAWRVAFYLTFGISFAAFATTFFTIPKHKKERHPHRFDVSGALLVTLVIFASVYGLSALGGKDATGIPAWLALGAGLLSCVLLVAVERRHPHPLLVLDLFKNLTFRSSLLTSLISFSTMYAPTILIPFYLQATLGLAPQVAGLYLLAFPLAMFVLSPVSGYLSDHWGSRPLVMLALALNGAALTFFGCIEPSMPDWIILVPLFVMGIGLGLFQSPNNSAAMGSVPQANLGSANGILQLVKNLGMVLGMTASTVSFAAVMAGRSLTDRASFLEGSRYVYWGAAVLSFAGVWVASWRPHKNPKN